MNIFTQICKKSILSIVLGASALTGFAADIPLSGQGTETSPYLIGSVNDLRQIVAYMLTNKATMQGSYLSLTSDIDLTGVEFTPIGEFDGCFDGQGHIIKGISYTTTASYQGVFTTIGTKGSVKNLTLKGTITSDNTYTGGFTGTLKGSIDNCVNQIDINSTKTNTAGFAAKAISGSSLSKCVNQAEITSSMGNLAGIVSDSESGVSYTECGNTGVI
ncbi:MAG: hypothetical protein K2M65_07360, partial [Muribaculaceae bacterium]|nr:hypothetical protein [Muribaculaceae bacterium]